MTKRCSSYPVQKTISNTRRTVVALAIALLVAQAALSVSAQAGPDFSRLRRAMIHTGAGLCLEVNAPEIARNGGRVQAWACNGQPQQRWTYAHIRSALRIGSGFCLDVHAPEMTTNGGRVQVWTCNGAPQQQWTPLANGSLRNAGGLCLDVHAPDQARNGARVQVWQCNGSQQQRFTEEPPNWSITPDTSVRPPVIQ